MRNRMRSVRWRLVAYDSAIFLLGVVFLLLVMRSAHIPLEWVHWAVLIPINYIVVFVCRGFWKVYRQVWRYGGTNGYIRLMLADGTAFIVNALLIFVFPWLHVMALTRLVAVSSVNLLAVICMRMLYVTAYRARGRRDRIGWILSGALRIFAKEVVSEKQAEQSGHRIRIAIIGAGSVGAMLAEELLNNPTAVYRPVCFADVAREKVGRVVVGLPVLPEDEAALQEMSDMGVQEVVFTLSGADEDRLKDLYSLYSNAGFRVKTYDYSAIRSVSGKRQLREFDVEELLFRSPHLVSDQKTTAYYKGKTVLITGGGGSIGSELCRQIAGMDPKTLVILDIYENGAYDVQQELRIAYGDKPALSVEIVSVTDREGLEKVFGRYRPQIIIHAAAHKHVPLMERNCVEAVKNNVFGTLNVAECAIKFGAERMIMVSTDKAVNPTNVMGATKRMCEMLVETMSRESTKTTFSATRFGNVLGSSGSVIPLFKRQIASGGPVTVTDKRIIRYFMTIPEASQLVLQSGAMAKNGELFVLDMGKPVKIYDLAENMIRLSGLEPGTDIEIVETGLRPGEKLYEELLVKPDTLTKTANHLIFIERDEPLSAEQLTERLALLRTAVESGDDEAARSALKQAVPTYHSPESVNSLAGGVS